jgi:hypothetical protein
MNSNFLFAIEEFVCGLSMEHLTDKTFSYSYKHLSVCVVKNFVDKTVRTVLELLISILINMMLLYVMEENKRLNR